MIMYIELTVGVWFILFAVITIVSSILRAVLGKESRLYKFLTKPYAGMWQVRGPWRLIYMNERLSERTNWIINTVGGLIIGVAVLILGLNALLKGLTDPFGPEFWVLF